MTRLYLRLRKLNPAWWLLAFDLFVVVPLMLLAWELGAMRWPL